MGNHSGSFLIFYKPLTCCIYQGFHPTWKTLNMLKTWNFVIFFSRPGKCWNLFKKWLKLGILTQNLEKLEICKFYVSRFTFQDVIYKNNFDLHLCHIYIIQKKWFEAKLNLDFIVFTWITWKIHGILCHKRSRNTASVQCILRFL